MLVQVLENGFYRSVLLPFIDSPAAPLQRHPLIHLFIELCGLKPFPSTQHTTTPHHPIQVSKERKKELPQILKHLTLKCFNIETLNY